MPSESTFKDKKIEGVKLLQDEGKNIILDSETMSNRLKQFLLNQFFKDLNDMKKEIIVSYTLATTRESVIEETHPFYAMILELVAIAIIFL